MKTKDVTATITVKVTVRVPAKVELTQVEHYLNEMQYSFETEESEDTCTVIDTEWIDLQLETAN